MGLSGRKIKQRIPADPRNLTWADDAAKFGTNYLSKFGWDASKGLGVDGDGRTSHVKVSHKLDMLGIGAAHQKDPDGIAWKQNKDFENLLKRLNEAAAAESIPTANAAEEEDIELEAKRGDSGEEKEKKRKRTKDVEGVSEEKAKKKRKKSKEAEKSDQASVEPTENIQEIPEVKEAPSEPPKPYIPRHRAHRARAIASKSMASKSSAAIAEILGIAPTPTSSASTSGLGTPLGKLTSLEEDGTVTLEKLTTSTKSVADYFKEKLLAKSSKSGTATPLTPQSELPEDSWNNTPRGGLGSSRLLLETKQESLDLESQRIGISKFSSLMSSTFLSTTFSLSTSSEPTPEKTPEPATKPEKKRRKKESQDGNDDAEQKRDKEKRKEKRDMDVETTEEVEKDESKEERRRLRAEKKARKAQKLQQRS
ncbi:Protein PXR1 [Hypsizygus marmoreus]|uniref:Protein PXR1 n=1 Tax=Hypsizygus marmoreus TaxID=39966 RepID=A0A369K1C1_HYPMA|nr:Protein PXR1 [Hypsizygus marmoreus]